MEKKEKRLFLTGGLLVVVFAVWTALIQLVDVQPAGQKGTDIGFADFNVWFHELIGEHLFFYDLTDYFEAIPLLVCVVFAVIGIVQLIKRKSLWKVDRDLVILGIYYAVVILVFVAFEIIPVNYRPLLIEGKLEASYPSSTTLLVLSVMPTFMDQIGRRMKNASLKLGIHVVTILYMLFMVGGRLVSGVHWFTDIAGSVFFSTGIFCIYRALVLACLKGKGK